MNYHRLKPVVSGPPKLNSFDEAIGPSSYRLEAIVVDLKVFDVGESVLPGLSAFVVRFG